MPIEFAHFLSGVAAVCVIGLVFRRRLTHPIFYLWAVFTFMVPDVDHLAFWNYKMLSALFPHTWEDLTSSLFAPRHPFLLHSWLFPAAIAAGMVYCRSRDLKWWKYLAILAVGWAIHLAMDGVMLL